MSEKPTGMTPYEDARWEAIQAWRSTTPRSLSERLPDNVRDRTKQVAEKAGQVWDKVPGNDALERALATAIKGGFDMALDITESTINERKVVERVTQGLAIEAQATTIFVASTWPPSTSARRRMPRGERR